MNLDSFQLGIRYTDDEMAARAYGPSGFVNNKGADQSAHLISALVIRLLERMIS